MSVLELTTNIKHVSCKSYPPFLFLKTKNKELQGRFQVISRLLFASCDLVLVFYLRVLLRNKPSLFGHQPLSWLQTDPALGATAGICSRAGKQFCCCVCEREEDLELVFEAPGLRLIGQEV